MSQMSQKKCFKVTERDSDGRTPLHHAALKDSVEVANVLLYNNADVNAKNTVLFAKMDQIALLYGAR